jgi:hypothetical protein
LADSYLSDQQNLADLVARMPEEDRNRFNGYGHNRVEAVFVDRIFIVYKPTGLTRNGHHRPPEILNTIKVIDFRADPYDGSVVTLVDDKCAQELKVGHVPKRLYNYPIYVSVPSRLQLRWDARHVGNEIRRSLSFALLIKTKNKSSFYSMGNVYAETPRVFKELYPEVNGQFTF